MNPYQSPLASKEPAENTPGNGHGQVNSPDVPANDENASPLGQNSDAPDIDHESRQNAIGASMAIENPMEEKVEIQETNPYTTNVDSVHDENGSGTTLQDPDPNTSAGSLNLPPSSNKQYATPLKLLPPLKDIDHITTPKSFDVAKDVVKPMRSSPIDSRANFHFPELAETGEDVFDATANDTFGDSALRSPGKHDQASMNADLEAAASFLGVEPSTLLSAGQNFILRISQRAHSYHGLQSEFSFFKLNQEQINQVQLKKYELLQKEVERVSALNDSLKAENDIISNTSLTQESELIKINSKLKNATQKLKEMEADSINSEKSSSTAIDSKIQEILSLNENVSQLTKLNIEQGIKLSAITKELNEATNEKFSAKLDFSKVKNELMYLKGQKDWYETQLKSIQGKYTDLIKRHDTEFYRDANKISSLTSQNETLKSLKDSLTVQVSELQAKVDSYHASLSEAENKLESCSLKFSRECSNKDDTIELLNVQLTEKNERILQLEEYAEEMKAATAETLSAIEHDNNSKTEKIISLQEKLKRTEEALDSELHKETELPKLAPSAEMILQEGNSGISLSALYTEFNHIKKELVLEKSQKEKLANQLQHFVSELESKKPAIANYRNQIQFYENSMKDLLENMETIRIDKVESEKEANRLRARISSNEIELHSLKQLCRDLGMQLCYYLIHSKIRDDNEDPLSAQEKKAIDQILAKSGYKDNADESDTDRLITERLITFGSLIELQKKNEELTIAVRLLGKQLEDKDLDSNGFEAAAVEEAKEAILTLQGELQSLTLKYEAVSKERDLIKSLNGGTSQLESQLPELKTLRDSNADLMKRVHEHESAMQKLQTQSEERFKKLNDKISELNSEKETLKLKVASTKYSVELAQNRLETTKKLLGNLQEELDLSRKETLFWKEQSSKQEEILVKKSNELRDAERDLFNHMSSTRNLLADLEVLKSLNSSLKSEIETLRKDKDQLGQFASSLQSILKEREASSLDLSTKLAQSVSNYQSLQEKIEQKEEKILILTSQSELAMKAQNAKLEQVSDLSQKLLEARSRLAEKEALVESLKSKENRERRTFAETLDVTSTAREDSEIPYSEQEDLRNALRAAERQVSEFNNIAKSAEESLMKATESFDQYKVAMDEQLATLENEKILLNKLVKDYKEQIEQLHSEMKQNQERYDAQVQELKLKVEENSYKANSYDSLKADYESKLDSLSVDLKNQVSVTDETQKRYKEKFTEAELLNKQVVKQKEDASALQQKIDELTASLKQKDIDLHAKDDLLLEQSSNLRDELQATQIKLRDLEYQYALAISQLEIRNSTAEGDDGLSDEEMRQVISFLRSEKESAEAKCMAMADQLEQMKMEAESLSAELNVVKLQMSRVQSMKSELTDANKEHERLLEQLDQLNILRESNTTLRNENKALSERMAHLQTELETLSKKQNTEASNEGIDVEVQAQEIQLLKEENERIKAQLNNNQELKNLMQRFESLKSEFKAKLGVHRTKNRELEKELTELKLEQEKSKAAAKEDAGQAQELLASKAQLQDNEKKFNEQITSLRATFESEKRAMEANHKAELNNAVKEAKEPAGKASEDEIKQKLGQEFETKLAKHKQELDATFAKEVDAKVQDKLEEKLKSDGAKAPSDVEKIKQLLKQEYDQKIKDLNKDFEKKLASEKANVEKAVDKKYEFKLRVLNRKVERLELDKSDSPASSTKSDQPKLQPIGDSSTSGKTGQGTPKNEAFQSGNQGGNEKNPNSQKKRPASSNAPAPVNFKRNKE